MKRTIPWTLSRTSVFHSPSNSQTTGGTCLFQSLIILLGWGQVGLTADLLRQFPSFIMKSRSVVVASLCRPVWMKTRVTFWNYNESELWTSWLARSKEERLIVKWWTNWNGKIWEWCHTRISYATRCIILILLWNCPAHHVYWSLLELHWYEIWSLV